MSSTTLRRALVVFTAAGLLLFTGFASATGSTHAQTRPNIVFVLTDDLAWNLVQYMPHVQQMQRQGDDVLELLRHRLAVLPVALVDLQRALPAQHGIFTNEARDGGFDAFHARGEESEHVRHATSRPRGYRPAMMGKYLNGYTPAGPSTASPLHPAGLERVGRRRQRLPGVQLQPQRERARSSTTASSRRTT